MGALEKLTNLWMGKLGSEDLRHFMKKRTSKVPFSDYTLLVVHVAKYSKKVH